MGGRLVYEIPSEIGKFVMTSIKSCYKSVGDHPFVVCILLLFIFLHRSFPLLFSLLVSTSPIILCTALLLGTLLSFGQSNLPEIEPRDGTASLQTWVNGGGDDHHTVVVGSFAAQNFSVFSSREEEDDDNDVAGDVGEHDVYAPLINENVQSEDERRVTEDVDRDIELPIDAEADETESCLFQKVRDQILEGKDDNVSSQGGGDDFEESLLGGYGHDESGEGSDDDDDDDSGSDGAESSSPDASLADILPMLDEIYPLLDLEAPHPQPDHMSHDGSDAASSSSDESDEDSEDRDGRVDEGDEVDYNGGDEEEVPAQSGAEDESKSVIKWTDDDQKNLMDLGNLELERNRRLENLIARRRARKSFKLMAEKNLIDFDGFDIPFNVSPISTARRNPFDSPFDDSYGNMGLTPIPGSAPSIMLAWRNPFDLPYDSNEEKPDLKGDHFEQEFIASHANDAFFRRHESFNLGASSLGGAKHERQDFKWKPVFVPERLASEGPDYSVFQRQASEVSESKLSSVPDSDSVTSVPDLDDRKFSEEYFTTEAEVVSNIYHASGLVDHGSHSYEDIYSMEMEQADRRDAIIDQHGIHLGERQDLEPSLSDNGGLPSHVSNEFHSSRETVEEENRSSRSSVSDNGGLHTHVINELHFSREIVEEEDKSSRSILSSLSEGDEEISDVREGELRTEPSGDLEKEVHISRQHSLAESDAQFLNTMVDDNQFKEPVYGSIPLEAENLISLNSISSDLQAEISELVTLQASAEMNVPFEYKNNDVLGENLEKATSGDEEIFGAASKAHGADETEGDLRIYNQLPLTCSPSEVEVSLPRNLEVNATSSESGYPYLVLNEHASEQETDLSWLGRSMVEPCLDNPSEALVTVDTVKEEVEDLNEIDAELLSELDSVGDFSVKEVVGEPLHYELTREESNSLTIESGLSTADFNLSKANSGLPIFDHIHEEVDTDVGLKQIHEGVDVVEGMFPSVVDNEHVSEHTVQTGSSLQTVEATCFEEDIISPLNQSPHSSVKDFPQLPDAEELSEIHTELHPEGNVVSTDVLHDDLGDISSNNIGSTFQGSLNDHNTFMQLSEDNVTQLPGSSNLNDVLANVVTEAVGESVLSNVDGVDKTTSPTKKTSKDAFSELPIPSKLKDGCEEAMENVGHSVVKTVLNNAGSGVQETIPSHRAPKQVSDIVAAETIEIASANREVVQEPVTTQVSEENVDLAELPKSSVHQTQMMD